ncbi:IS66 family insertion sequence element accessory protein TnpA [Paenibacillus sinopodophylli]|uniref:IS66 family insertion sequence element accessory protein TnpA n=1 Tax=Paenibacillus sinopodophylli TaxID=1837342 RepID=UPI00110CF824|nr:IS66 family insertion sequence element accessory protein TnpB [Paenibacillus sinopodophylli]
MKETGQEIWARHIATYQKSGQTMKAWCAQENLKVHQLKYWLYKSPIAKPTETSTTFRAVAIQHSQHEPLWVQVGVARIAVRTGFEPQLLRDVVAALDLLC